MKFIVVGSTGLIGSYVAKTLSKYGTVVGVSRTTDVKVDVKDPASIKAMYEKVGKVDAVASCIGKVVYKPITEISYDDYLISFKDKALGQVELVRAGIDLPRGLRINTVSPNVLTEATSYHAKFAGYHQVSAQSVADAYVKSILGKQTGQIYKLD
jgi:hypothetical protein